MKRESRNVDRLEQRSELAKLINQGMNINSRCMGCNYVVENYPEYPTWKNQVLLFVNRHLSDHPFTQQLIDAFRISRYCTNNFTDILNLMLTTGQDSEYWKGQSQSMGNNPIWGIPQNQSAFSQNTNQTQQTMASFIIDQSNGRNENTGLSVETEGKQKVFIVHGHDNEAKIEMARTLEKLGFEAIILHEQPNAGYTIIEKIAAYSDVVFAVVLYTECDLGRDKTKKVEEEQYRARQNVVFEHGYLIGKLDREKVAAFVKGNVETPGDISGVVYTTMDNAGAWKQELVREMRAAGLNVDFNKLI